MADALWKPWMAEARCLDADPEMFFPEKGAQIGDARRICMDCPVAADCLAYALDFAGSYDYGMWGGASPRDRKRLRRRIANGEPARDVIAEALADLPPVHQDRGGAEMAGERAMDAA